MSELKVDKITPRLGTTLTLGDSGDTINFGSGVLPNFENLTVTGDLTVDTNSLKVDSTNNFVGIGTATPAVALDVVGAITATGNITGTLATAAQPNITSVGTLTSATVSGDLTVDTNTLYVDSTNNRVGVRTSSPTDIFQIDGPNSQLRLRDTDDSTYVQLSQSASKLVIRQNTLLADHLTIGSSELIINDTSNDYDFRVESDNYSHALFIQGSNGGIGIGTSTLRPAEFTPTDGVSINGNILGQIQSTTDSNTNMLLNRDTTDGKLIEFRKDGSEVGSIVTYAGDITIGTTDTAIRYDDGADALIPWNISTNSARTDAIDLGASTVRFNEIFFNGQLRNTANSGLKIDSSGNATFNENSIDADFRVESDGLTHAFHLDGTDGRIGIGTTAISGARLQVSETSNGVFAGRFTNSHATGSYGIAVLGGNSSSNYTADFATKDGTSLMRIRGDGNVGIGTTSPATPLHLTSTSYPQFRITNAISFSMGVDSNNDLIFDPTSGSTRDIIFQNSGAGDIRVGIGTTSPSALLDLGGAGSSFQSGQEKITIAAAPSPYSYYPSLSSHNRSYLHLTGSGGGSAFNTSIHGYQVANPAGGSYMRVASDLTNAYVFYHKTDVTGFKWYADYNKSSGDADFTPSTEVSFNFETDTGAIVFNESSRDRDFRVESNNNANMLFVDGGSDEVGIGTASPSGTLDIASSDANYQLVITPSGTNASGTINFNSPGSGGAKIRVQGTERVSISSAGVFNITGSLTVNGSAVGGGKVLQVVSATKTDTATTSSTTYGDITGLSVSITPSSASSKIYVVFSVSAGNSNGSANYRLVRNTTALAIGDASGSRTQSTISSQAGTTNRMEGLGSNYLDSPSTTSATTYKVQWRVQNSGTNIYLNRSSSDADNESHPRGSSTITVMEIGA